MTSRGMPAQQYTIGGVRVVFPCKAYPTQLSMMSMIIKGIDREQNCLLESPTGSGKSLALLCSSLAWQHTEYEKREKEIAEMEHADECAKSDDQGCCKSSVVCICNCAAQGIQQKAGTNPQASSTENQPGTSANPINLEPAKIGSEAGKSDEPDHAATKPKITSTDEEDDFQPAKKRFRTPVPMSRFKHRGIMYEEDSEEASTNSHNPHTQAHWQIQLKNQKGATTCSCPCHLDKGKNLSTSDEKGKDGKDKMPRRIPKIYFGTRTHKQIAQIIRELKKTVYRDSRMSILGSREYTCVHPRVSKGPNKNEGCRELVDGKYGQSCAYKNGTHKIKSQWQLMDRDERFREAWDIEDLCKLGKKIRACPYFASRALKDDADVVFCPYNYLIDPVIRDSMEIYLKDQIMVLDEAHNIEDSARDAASYSVAESQLQETIDELHRLEMNDWRKPHTTEMHKLCVSLKQWISGHDQNTMRQKTFNSFQKVFSGHEIDGVLRSIGVVPDSLPTYGHHLASLTEENREDREEDMLGLSLSSASGMLLKGLFIVIGFLFKGNKKFMKDYKIALIRKTPEAEEARQCSNEPTMGTTLHFWCLNPAVAFSDIGDEVRSIILTSGTLSPMTSFALELGVNFPIQLEANHVIHKSQVWVGTVAMGPSGTSLNASFKNAETFAFQDDIGRLLLQVCDVIPYGVLCFLPSYSILSKLKSRWETTGTWAKLLEKKQIMMEARGDKTEFDEQLRDYYGLIKECEESDLESQSVTGGLFFAVCRGKVSEGMDFADNNARAVITIGIPFPSYKDTQVELKRQYNDNYSSSRGLLTGSEWYEIQAYRALNQALGRCIRHKMDWGALILVDERYNRNPKKYISGLSKWVRAKVTHHLHSRDAVESLSDFAQARLLKPCPEISDTSTTSPPSTQSPSAPGPSTIIKTAGFTPSVVTTPSSAVKIESAPGYTPIANTPVRPSTNQSIAITPNVLVVKGGSANPSSTPNMVNAASAQKVVLLKTTLKLVKAGGPNTGTLPNMVVNAGASGSLPVGAQQAHNTTKVIYANGMFMKASAILPGALPLLMAGTNKPDQSTPRSVPAAGMNIQDNNVAQSNAGTKAHRTATNPSNQTTATGTAHMPATKRDQSAPGSVHATGMNVQTKNVAQQQAQTPTGNPVSLRTPLFQGRTEHSPEQGGVGCGNLDSSIATPKAKLNFVGEGTSKKNPVSKQSCASKLQKFAYKTSGDHRGKQGSKSDASKFYAFVDLAKDDEDNEVKQISNGAGDIVQSNDCKENAHDADINGNHGNQEMEKNRLEFNQTPPLFDSEYTGSMDETIIPESPERTEGNPAEMRDENESRGTKRKLDNLDDDKCTSEVAEADERKDVKTKEEGGQEDNVGQKSRAEEKPSGRSRRGRLSRRRSEEKRTPVKDVLREQESTVKQDTECNGDGLEEQVSVRRSARRRHGPGGKHSKLTSSDFLDTIGDAKSQSGVCLPTCRSGLFCLHCDEDLSANLQDIQGMPTNELPSEFLRKQTKSLHSKSGKRNKKPTTCQCKEKTGTSKIKDVWLVGRKELLRHCEPFTEGTKVHKGITLNAHWCESDQCCYRPVACGSCPSGFVQLGFEVLASNNNKLLPGQIWFPPDSIGHCHQARIQKMTDDA